VQLTFNRLGQFGPLFILCLFVSACVSSPEIDRPRRPVTFPRPQSSPRPLPPVATPANFTIAPPTAMAASIRSLWASFPDRAGVAVARTDGTWMLSQRGDEFMPQQSVSKLWVAIAVMQAVDEGRIQLNDTVTLRDTDLTVFHQPIEEMIDADGFETTIGALLQAAMTMSDNTANDFLMRRVGGPQAIRSMLAAKGLSGIRFGPGETGLQSLTAGLPWRPEYRFKTNFQKARALLTYETRKAALENYIADPIDGATPMGIARALIRLKRGELLSPASTQHLLYLMAASETGKQRLRAGVPAGWSFAHKTGTGQDFDSRTAGYNDVALMTAPDGTSYAVVVLIADTTKPIPDRQAFMQGITASIGYNHRK
jgi:beta-lactamase class A